MNMFTTVLLTLETPVSPERLVKDVESEIVDDILPPTVAVIDNTNQQPGLGEQQREKTVEEYS